MKVIGLIGGMSWESSKAYYELVNKRVHEFLGGSHSGKSIMVSVDFAEIEKLTFEGRWDEIGLIMAECASKLERAGADIVLLCTNTIHLVSKAIEENIDIPFLHIADATGEEIRKKEVKKVALLGTRFTMEKDFYTKILEEKFDLEIQIPSKEDRQIIHDIIYNELVKGQFVDSSKEKCLNIIKRMQAQGTEGVILGCTELPLLIPDSAVEIPTFDTSKIHVYKAVEWAIDN